MSQQIPASVVPAAHHTGPINPRTSNLAARPPHRRGDHHMFLTSDDNAMMKHILETHIPDGRDFDVKPLVHIIEDIVHRATPIAGRVHVRIIIHLTFLYSLINFYILTVSLRTL